MALLVLLSVPIMLLQCRFRRRLVVMLHRRSRCTGRPLSFYVSPPLMITIIGRPRWIKALILTRSKLVVLLFTSRMARDEGPVMVEVTVQLSLAFRYLQGLGLS